MASVPDILPYFQLVGQVALILGAIFAGYQFLLHRRQRQDQASLGVLTQLQTPEFHQAYTYVWELPVDASAEEWKAAGKPYTDAAEAITMTFETLGVMVHSRMVPLDLVDQVIGGFLRESWRRTHKFLEHKRETLQNPRIGEWYQWLAERLDVRRRRRDVGAYQAFKNWKE